MISFENVSLKAGEKQVLKSFCLNIAQGEKVILSSPSGSGKTCLLNLVMGFMRPDRGRIWVNDIETSPANMQHIRRMIGYMSRDIDFPPGRVSKVFEEILVSTKERSSNYYKANLRDMIRTLNLQDDIIHKNTVDISGRERQVLGWALIMLLDRPILLLDEPTSALSKQQTAFFVDYASATDKTIICASHDYEWQNQKMIVIDQLMEDHAR